MKPRTFRPYVPKKASHELDMQRRVCNYLKKNYAGVLFHSDFAAGLHLTPNQAKINKSLQSGPGFPDLIIFGPGRINAQTGLPYVGLVLELKKEGTVIKLKIGPNKGKLTTDSHIREQAVILRKFNEQGYFATFGVGYLDTIRTINWYFGRKEQSELF